MNQQKCKNGNIFVFRLAIGPLTICKNDMLSMCRLAICRLSIIRPPKEVLAFTTSLYDISTRIYRGSAGSRILKSPRATIVPGARLLQANGCCMLARVTVTIPFCMVES